MKILLAIDGSPCSEAAILEVENRPWPEGSEVRVLSVASSRIPMTPDPVFLAYASHLEAVEEDHKRAKQRVAQAAQRIKEKAPDLKVTTLVLDESPKKVIVEEAERWGADLVVMGSHGYGPVKRFVLGSVSHAVALHAPCSVEIVRSRQPVAS